MANFTMTMIMIAVITAGIILSTCVLSVRRNGDKGELG